MKLMTKFNLIVLLLFGTGAVLISQMAYDFLINNARRQVLQEAELMMASAEAVREYTSFNVEPLLRQPGPFHPETVPSFGAITTLGRMSLRYPEYADYAYREAALNPRKLEHRAYDWEADVIQWLQKHPDQAKRDGEIDTTNGRSLYLAKPIKMESECVVCHSTPEMAPDNMIKEYDNVHGFRWVPGEIVAAQVVTVPMSVPVGIATRAFRHLLLYLIVTLLVTIAALDAGVYWFVIRPLKQVSENANRVSKGEKDVPPLPVRGKDEISDVTASFNRMQVSMAKAFRMLE